MGIEVSDRAMKDLVDLPDEVVETYLSKKDAMEKSLNIGATPRQAFDKFLSGNMHPVLQINLGRDYRAWFIEGEYIENLEDDKIYGWRVLNKKEAKKLTGKIRDPLSIFESDL
ncbi:hypothetical protein [Candidatus Nanohalobium constans]|uniref:Uncharacterized protein n=1 Tax=Candidatus Nanohalobium constans TaxID=2565781 RepID=A0A5Q0UEL1_9ARCH|nr:hypothetical protein [Candidatus Nanohalobium constans]QGA79966.1 hypothetical protein LC1Nh_0058 [Candidatus Nanohalobium constans]